MGHTRSKGACACGGTCRDEGVCAHRDERRGKGEFARRDGDVCVCAHTGWGCMCARACVCTVGMRRRACPLKARLPSRLRRRCVTSDTFLPGGSRAAPALPVPCRAGSMPSSPGCCLLPDCSFGRRRFLIPARHFPVLGVVPLLPAARRQPHAIASPPSIPACVPRCVGVFIYRAAAEPACRVGACRPPSPSGLPSPLPRLGTRLPPCPSARWCANLLAEAVYNRGQAGSGTHSQQHHARLSSCSSAPFFPLARPRCSLQACLRSCCWVKLPSPEAHVS